MQNCKSRCGEQTKIMISYASSLRGLAMALKEICDPRSLWDQTIAMLCWEKSWQKAHTTHLAGFWPTRQKCSNASCYRAGVRNISARVFHSNASCYRADAFIWGLLFVLFCLFCLLAVSCHSCSVLPSPVLSCPYTHKADAFCCSTLGTMQGDPSALVDKAELHRNALFIAVHNIPDFLVQQ